MSELVKMVKPKPPSEVITAKLSDIDDLITFLCRLRNEIDDGEIEQDILVSHAINMVKRRDGIVFIVRGKRGIEGSLGIRFERKSLTRAYHLQIVWNIVAPAARQTGHASSLLKTAIEFANALDRRIYLNAPRFHPQMVELRAAVEPSPKVRLYSRHFHIAGRIFAHFPESQEVTAS